MSRMRPKAVVAAKRRRRVRGPRAPALGRTPVRMPSRGLRALRACAVLLAIALLAAAVEAVGRSSRPSALREASDVFFREDGRTSVLQSLDDGAEGALGAREAPPSFEDEVLSLEGRADVRVDERGGVVGFSVEDRAGEAFAAVSRELEARGWTGVESGAATCGTFAKDRGAYRWAFASCVQVGSTACVVVQVVPLEQEGA